MRLNAQTDFALRVLMLLATKKDRTVTIQEAAQTLNLSQAHLMRVCAKLTGGGLTAAVRGRNGGLALARPADEISVEEVVKLMEPDFSLVECFKERGASCSILSACVLNTALSDAMEAFFLHLRHISIHDLVSPHQAEMARIFTLSPLTDRSVWGQGERRPSIKEHNL